MESFEPDDIELREDDIGQIERSVDAYKLMENMLWNAIEENDNENMSCCDSLVKAIQDSTPNQILQTHDARANQDHTPVHIKQETIEDECLNAQGFMSISQDYGYNQDLLSKLINQKENDLTKLSPNGSELADINPSNQTRLSRKRKSSKPLSREQLFGLNNIVSCELCGLTFGEKNDLIEHMKTHSNGDVAERTIVKEELPYTCSTCALCFKEMSELKDHEAIHKKSLLSHSCEFCHKAFKTKAVLTKHMRAVHSNGRIYTCSRCAHAFQTRDELTHHSNSGSCEKEQARQAMPHVCSECGRAFRLKHQLAQHKTRHTDDKPHACALCDYTAAHRHTIKRHMKVHLHQRTPRPRKTDIPIIKTADADKPYACTDCSYTCKASHTLRRHVRYVHMNVRPHVCSVCGTAFKSRAGLNYHSITHLKQSGLLSEAIKPFRCHLCEYSTTHVFMLKRHLVVHTDVRPYACNQCTNRFKTMATLNAHKRTHQDLQLRDLEKIRISSSPRDGKRHKKEYICTICGYVCRDSSRLKLHSVVHSTERPFKCDECLDKFKTRATLMAHKRNRHIEIKRPQTCSYCGITLLQPKSFAKHLIRCEEKFSSKLDVIKQPLNLNDSVTEKINES